MLADREHASAGFYNLYGVTLRSEIPLIYPSVVPERPADVTLSLRDASWFSTLR